MGLKKYRQKRSFDKTPEPEGGKPAAGQLHFVVQKHAASHLHYDFRLEMDGVLKSWAVPKGPSTDPSVKRLAMMVEDHPYDYRRFEGIIPKGQYGGGTVIVWDEGVYEPVEGAGSKKEIERKLLHQLHKGKVVFTLHGQKLKGQYALVKGSYQGENAWLLMKMKDKYAKTSDVTKKAKSVLSGKTIEQVARTSDKVWNSNRQEKRAAAKKIDVKKLGRKKAMPTNLSPMLATLVDAPFDDPEWSYEVKWDGYRAVAYVNNTKVNIRSRNNKSFDEKFYPIHDALKKLKLKAVLDGEIIVAGKEGISNFGSLQNWRSEADGDLQFFVFDILWLDGYSLMHLPLSERRAILEAALPDHPLIHPSKAFDATGTEFFEAAQKMGLEGIIAKRISSDYKPGFRTRDWLKIKVAQRHEVVIGGYTENKGSSKTFSSLLVGVYKGKRLHYTGKIGTGFTDKQQKEMMKQFKKLETKTCPFEEAPDVNKPSRFRPNPPQATVTWLKPKLVCEVSYTEMTSDDVMRHPSFEGMREDKKATDVKAEKAEHVEEVIDDAPTKGESVLHKKKMLTKQGKKERKTLLNPTNKTQERVVNGHTLKFTNLDKLYWPAEKFSKRDLLNYYYKVAPYMLPYLVDRPQSLNRHPNGIKGKSFYQKNVTGKVPDWIETFPYFSEGESEQKNFLVCSNEASLLYMASLGCIEINPWSSRVQKPDHPDWCILDIDPDNNSFDKVVETALVIRQVLEAVDVKSYVKTSGSTGIHVYVPLGAKYTYEQSKEFARVIVKLVHEELPSFTSVERATRLRKGKIYLDFLQNRPQATLAAPYSVRPKPGASVSAPLDWDEVKKGMRIKDFTIENMPARLLETDDLFKPVLGKGIDMKKVIRKIETVFH